MDSENIAKEILTVRELERAIEVIRPINYVEYVNFESNKVTLGSLLQRIWISAGAPTYINTQMSNANQYCVDAGLVEKERLQDINAPIDRYSAAEILLRYYYSIDMTVTSNSASQTDESGDTLNSVDIIDDAIVKLLFTIDQHDTEVLLPTDKFTENQMEDITEFVENHRESKRMRLPLPGSGEVIQKRLIPIHIVYYTLSARFGNSDTKSSSSEDGDDQSNSDKRMVYNLEFCIDSDNGITFANKINDGYCDFSKYICNKQNYTLDGWYVGKYDDADNILWRCVDNSGNIKWLAQETDEYHKKVVKNNGAIYNITSENVVFDAKWLKWTSADAFKWTVNKDQKTATITKYIGTDENVVIPSSINGYTVTRIGNSAFFGCSELTNINIPDGVTSIGNYVFYNCSKLTNINIPDSVTSIGNYAFYGCSELTSINIPNGVTSIGNYAFNGCSKLTNINIPDSVTSIGDWVFGGCSKLTSINIPYGVTSIGSSAFRGCSSLININIPDSVTIIGNCAFYGCSKLASINIPNSVTSIGTNAFQGCVNLTIFCRAGSCAETYAKNNNISYQYIV